MLRPILWYGEHMILAVVRDVHERKQNQQAIIDSERKYRLLTENMQDVIWQVDAEFRFTYVSPSNEKVFGFSRPSEFIGQPVWKFVAPRSIEKTRQDVEKSMAQLPNHIRWRTPIRNRSDSQGWKHNLVRDQRHTHSGRRRARGRFAGGSPATSVNRKNSRSCWH